MNITLQKEMNEIRKRTMFKGCLHKDTKCNGDKSDAHSIQLHRYLDSISDNGEVICIDFSKLDETNHLQIKPVGIKKLQPLLAFVTIMTI